MPVTEFGEGGGPRVLIVQPAPTAIDIDRSEYGRAGQAYILIDTILRAYPNASVRVTSALRCRTADNRDKETENAIEACRSHLVNDFRWAEVVLAVGSTPTRALLGERVVFEDAEDGFAIADGKPVAVLPELLVLGSNRFLTVAAKKKALDFIAGKYPRSYFDAISAEYHIAESADDVAWWLSGWTPGVSKFVAIDAETFGNVDLDGDDAQIVTAALAYRCEHGIRVLVLPRDSGPMQAELRAWLRANDSERVAVGHNFAFDLRWMLHKWNVNFQSPTADTRIMRLLLRPTAAGDLATSLYAVGLGGAKAEAQDALEEAKSILSKAEKVLDAVPPTPPPPPANHNKPKTAKQTKAELAVAQYNAAIAGITPRTRFAVSRIRDGRDVENFAYAYLRDEVLYRYVARDAVGALLLAEELSVRIQRNPHVRQTWEHTASKLHKVALRIAETGLPVDVPALRIVGDEMDAIREDAVKNIEELFKSGYAAPIDANGQPHTAEKVIGSGKLIGETLAANGKHTGGSTDSGRMATDASALEALGDDPFVKQVLRYRKADKVKGTYVAGVLSHLGRDGRVHPSFLPIGAETFRASMREPNTQNIPTRDELGKRIRNCFVAPPGYYLVEHDYSQFQLRIAAALCGDQKMIELFQRGEDMHLGTAKLIARDYWGISPDEVTSEHRRFTKTLNFALLFGMVDATIANTLHISVERAAELRAAIFGTFPKLAEMIATSLEEAKETGGVWVEAFGARAYWRPLYDIDSKYGGIRSRAQNGAYNTKIQGPEAVWAMRAAVEVEEALAAGEVPGAELANAVHDSLMGIVPCGMLPKYDAFMRRMMTRHPLPNGVPIVVDMKYGTTWGTLKEAHA